MHTLSTWRKDWIGYMKTIKAFNMGLLILSFSVYTMALVMLLLIVTFLTDI